MSPDEIRSHIARLDTRNVAASEAAWAELRPLRADIVPYLLDEYRRARRGELRLALVFHSIKFARVSEPAFELGLAALQDRTTLVRYRACGLLAYSLRRDALPGLRALLTHADARTVADAKAAIDAIEHQNHHFFIDRTHSGRSFWTVPPP